MESFVLILRVLAAGFLATAIVLAIAYMEIVIKGIAILKKVGEGEMVFNEETGRYEMEELIRR